MVTHDNNMLRLQHTVSEAVAVWQLDNSVAQSTQLLSQRAGEQQWQTVVRSQGQM